MPIGKEKNIFLCHFNVHLFVTEIELFHIFSVIFFFYFEDYLFIAIAIKKIFFSIMVY